MTERGFRKRGWPAMWGLCLLLLPGGGGGQEVGRAGRTLTLGEAVESALEHNPAPRMARTSVQAGEARHSAVAAARLPALSFHTSLVRFQEPMLVAPLHRFDLLSPPLLDRSLVRGAVSLSYTLYDGGARGARIRASAAGVEAVRAAAGVAEMEVTLAVVRAYLGILTGRELVAAHAKRMEALEAEVNRVRRFLAEGKVARVSLLRAEAALAEAGAEGATAGARLRFARLELALLTGMTEDRIAESKLEAPRVGPVPSADPRDRHPSFFPGSRVRRPSLFRDPQAAHPSLLRAIEEVKAAESARAEARAGRLPAVSMEAAYDHFGTASGDFSAEWRAGLRLSYPIFTGGARRSAIDGAEAGLRIAREKVRLTLLALGETIERAKTAQWEALVRLEALEKAEIHHAEVARIEALALREGVGIQRDYLRAEAALFAVRAALAEARHALIAAIVMEAEAHHTLDAEAGVIDPSEIER